MSNVINSLNFYNDKNVRVKLNAKEFIGNYPLKDSEKRTEFLVPPQIVSCFSGAHKKGQLNGNNPLVVDEVVLRRHHTDTLPIITNCHNYSHVFKWRGCKLQGYNNEEERLIAPVVARCASNWAVTGQVRRHQRSLTYRRLTEYGLVSGTRAVSLAGLCVYAPTSHCLTEEDLPCWGCSNCNRDTQFQQQRSMLLPMLMLLFVVVVVFLVATAAADGDGRCGTY